MPSPDGLSVPAVAGSVSVPFAVLELEIGPGWTNRRTCERPLAVHQRVAATRSEFVREAERERGRGWTWHRSPSAFETMQA